jgi:amino acid transporter
VRPGRGWGWLSGGLFLAAALVVLIFAGVGIAQVFLAPNRDLHRGTIYESGYQIVRTRKYPNVPGIYRETRIPIVKIRLDDGSTHTLESTPLFKLFQASPTALHVDVQLSSSGYPKRVRYHGKWYGVGPPVWFWIVFGVVLLAVGLLLARAGIRRLAARAPNPAPST